MSTIDGMDLGRFGIWTFDLEFQPASLARESVQELEELGWSAFWFPEGAGREAMTQAGFLLSSTERMTIVNGIAKIGAREPRWTQGAAVLLADAYPGRHLLGLGVGDPRSKPLQAMGDYLDALDATVSANPQPGTPVRRLLAAYGPKMLELARDRSDGAHTYHVTVGHTVQAREVLGANPFTQKYNIAKFLRLGYTEADIDGGRGSDRLVDDLVIWGDLDTVVGKLHGHLDAGADHVAIQVLGTELGQTAMPHWRRLAEALLPERTAV